jgi:hypothetical protein
LLVSKMINSTSQIESRCIYVGPESSSGGSIKKVIRHPQSLCEGPHDLEREIRGLAYEKKKLLFRDGNKLNVGDRYGSRAPWLAVNQCHFPENTVSREVHDLSIADLNAHVATLDNEKLFRLFTFAENDAASSYSQRLDVVTGQKAKACLGRHCKLPNHEGHVSSITTPATRLKNERADDPPRARDFGKIFDPVRRYLWGAGSWR